MKNTSLYTYKIIIKVLIKRKILSAEAILSTYTHTHIHTQVPAHMSILTVLKLNFHTTEKRAANRDLRRMKTAARNGNMAGL